MQHIQKRRIKVLPSDTNFRYMVKYTIHKSNVFFKLSNDCLHS